MITDLWWIAPVFMFVLMSITWLIYLRIDRADIVDIAWAFGLATLGLVYAVVAEGWWVRKFLIGGMAAFWGFRLAIHLLVRIRSHSEDGRYVQLRTEWKTSLPRRFFVFYQYQAILNTILVLPFILSSINPTPSVHVLEVAGVVLWLVALAGESVADVQLKKFKSDPANSGKVCDVGLWKYSRHPNYFFEWLIWVSFFVFASGSAWGWISVLCPLLMLYFLLRVTGIPMTEAQSLRTRGEAYREYQKSTSMFIPWRKLRSV